MPSETTPPPATPSTGSQHRITQEIIRRYLISTVEEMVETTRRTAYSTVISEALDFTCGIFDERGRMVAQGAGLPVHAGGLLGAVEVALEAYGSDFAPGDVVIHNDTYRGGGHQADMVVIRPIFYGDALTGFAVNRGHWVDTGGMTAGGWSGTAEHVVQEALYVPPVKLYKRGEIDAEIRAIVLGNVRTPRQDWGDLQAQLASAITAERRIRTLMDRYGHDTVKEAEGLALEYSRRRFAAALAAAPNGVWSAEDFFEDHPFSPDRHYVRCTVEINDEVVRVDFAGTDPAVFAPINNSFTNTKAAAYIAALSVLDPTIPLNSGFLDQVEVSAPEGCLLHATWPHPVFLGPADPTNKACELVLSALGQALPDRAVAGSYQTGNNTTGSGLDPRTGAAFQWFLFGAGGCGARTARDGNSAEWHSTANCRNESIEQWEHQQPGRFEEFSLIDDSGGPGRTRGGLGYRRRIRLLAATQISATADRHVVGAWGLDGGERGQPNRFLIGRDGERRRLTDVFDLASPSKFANVAFRSGDEYVIESGGGGGLGDPRGRAPELVARDVAFGYVTRAAAESQYGVRLLDDLSVDCAGTASLRGGGRPEEATV